MRTTFEEEQRNATRAENSITDGSKGSHDIKRTLKGEEDDDNTVLTQ